MTKLYEAWKRLGVALPLALALAIAPAAAGQTTLGRVSGSVLDSSGAVLPGATITLTNQNTNQVQTTVSSENGTLRLRPGAGRHLQGRDRAAGVQDRHLLEVS